MLFAVKTPTQGVPGRYKSCDALIETLADFDMVILPTSSQCRVLLISPLGGRRKTPMIGLDRINMRPYLKSRNFAVLNRHRINIKVQFRA